MNTCCCIKSNLVPLIFKHWSEKTGKWMYNVSHFTCTQCLHQVAIDDRFARPVEDFKNESEYAKRILLGYDIGEYR